MVISEKLPPNCENAALMPKFVVEPPTLSSLAVSLLNYHSSSFKVTALHSNRTTVSRKYICRFTGHHISKQILYRQLLILIFSTRDIQIQEFISRSFVSISLRDGIQRFLLFLCRCIILRSDQTSILIKNICKVVLVVPSLVFNTLPSHL